MYFFLLRTAFTAFIRFDVSLPSEVLQTVAVQLACVSVARGKHGVEQQRVSADKNSATNSTRDTRSENSALFFLYFALLAGGGWLPHHQRDDHWCARVCPAARGKFRRFFATPQPSNTAVQCRKEKQKEGRLLKYRTLR